MLSCLSYLKKPDKLLLPSTGPCIPLMWSLADKPEPAEVKQAARKENEGHLARSGNFLDIEYPLFVFCGMRELDELIALALLRVKPDMNRILVQRRTAANDEFRRPFTAKVHLLEYQGDVIADAFDAVICDGIRIAVNTVAMGGDILLKCSVLRFKRKPLDMHLLPQHE